MRLNARISVSDFPVMGEQPRTKISCHLRAPPTAGSNAESVSNRYRASGMNDLLGGDLFWKRSPLLMFRSRSGAIRIRSIPDLGALPKIGSRKIFQDSLSGSSVRFVCVGSRSADEKSEPPSPCPRKARFSHPVSLGFLVARERPGTSLAGGELASRIYRGHRQRFRETRAECVNDAGAVELLLRLKYRD